MNMSEHAYWIHDRKEAPASVKGYLYLPSCHCSSCGHQAGIEKEKCPQCGAIMDQTAPEDPELPGRNEILDKMTDYIASLPDGTRTSTIELIKKYAGRDVEQLYGKDVLVEMDRAFCVRAKDDILVPSGIDDDSLGLPYSIPFIVMHHQKNTAEND